MSREDADDDATSALAARARASPLDPWLFYRAGWDWQWRSWSRVADQVARGAAVLRRELPKLQQRVAYDAGQDPDGIAAGLAIRAAGAVAVPVDSHHPPEDLDRLTWARVDGTSVPPGKPAEIIVLPAALSPLERTPPQPLELDPASTQGAVELPGFGELPATAATSAARRLSELLPAFDARPILCASPDLDPLAARLLEAWTLHAAAAWVLEPLADAFLETVLWARPNVVCGSAQELAKLAERLRERRHRRHLRLAAAVLLGRQELPAAARAIWRDVGSSIVSLPPEAVRSLVATPKPPDASPLG